MRLSQTVTATIKTETCKINDRITKVTAEKAQLQNVSAAYMLEKVFGFPHSFSSMCKNVVFFHQRSNLAF